MEGRSVWQSPCPGFIRQPLGAVEMAFWIVHRCCTFNALGTGMKIVHGTFKYKCGI